MKIKDMEKMQSPFVRNEDTNWLVIDKIADGMEWVFGEDVMAIEKLHGCLYYNTPILTDDGFISVGKIVNQKLDVNVLSYNFEKKVTEFKPIKHYHKERNVDGYVCVKIKQKFHGTRPKQLIVTPNHKFWVGERWKRADELKSGEYVYHLTKNIDFVRKQFILGSLLGDSSIYWGYGTKNCGFQCGHSIKQSEYFDLKLKILGNIVNEGKGYRGGFEGSLPNRRFNSVINKHMSDFIKTFALVKNKKTITKQWINSLTPMSLAIWYMDDGTLIKGNGKQREVAGFATNSFLTAEVELLQSAFLKYGISSNIQNSLFSKGNRLMLTADGSEIFFNLISPYIIKELQYKLPVKLRTGVSYWNNYVSCHENDLIKTQVIEVFKKDNKSIPNSLYQYDLEIADNSNYFASSILVHNTNVSILIQGGAVTGVWNRKRRITMFSKGNQAIMEGLTNSTTQISKLTDGQHFGELIGPSLHNNPYKLEKHVWIPFETFGQKNLKFKSWGKYPKDFDTISEWFKDLMPLYSLMKHGKNETDLFVEGIVFTHKDGRMAKLRRDMFSWFSGRRHKE